MLLSLPRSVFANLPMIRGSPAVLAAKSSTTAVIASIPPSRSKRDACKNPPPAAREAGRARDEPYGGGHSGANARGTLEAEGPRRSEAPPELVSVVAGTGFEPVTSGL